MVAAGDMPDVVPEGETDFLASPDIENFEEELPDEMGPPSVLAVNRPPPKKGARYNFIQKTFNPFFPTVQHLLSERLRLSA